MEFNQIETHIDEIKTDEVKCFENDLIFVFFFCKILDLFLDVVFIFSPSWGPIS